MVTSGKIKRIKRAAAAFAVAVCIDFQLSAGDIRDHHRRNRRLLP